MLSSLVIAGKSLFERGWAYQPIVSTVILLNYSNWGRFFPFSLGGMGHWY